MTIFAPFTQPARSTALSLWICPRLSQSSNVFEMTGEDTEHTVTKVLPDDDSDIDYVCTCGNEFQWQDQTHYSNTNPD